MSIKIAMSGYPNSGKSTVRNYLEENYNFEGASFASNLKYMCQYAFDLTDYQIYSQEGKECLIDKELTDQHIFKLMTWINRTHVLPVGIYERIFGVLCNVMSIPITPRNILRLVGTEICRHLISDTYHIDVVKQSIEHKSLIIFDDARFLNEFSICDYKILIKREGSTFKPVHASDNLLPENEYDYIIQAKSGDMGGIYIQVDNIMNSILKS